MGAVRKVRSYGAAWQRARGVLSTFHWPLAGCPAVCSVCPRSLFQDCCSRGSDVIQPGGTRCSFQCPTGGS